MRAGTVFMFRYVVLAGWAVIALVACDSGPSRETEKTTVQRKDFAPEEFGIGRHHTPNRACNREIDRLLDQIRLCYRNGESSGKCEMLQKKNSDSIKRLRNSARCAR